MVELIGLATIVALCWVLADGMANESDAEKRRLRGPACQPGACQEGAGSGTKRAA
jgi:hypothetical protein